MPVNAVLDADSGSIILPLDAIGFSAGEFAQVARVAVLSSNRCLAARGLETEPVARSFPSGDDRRFGLWTMRIARKYGYELEPIPGAPSDSWFAARSDHWRMQQVDCAKRFKSEAVRFFENVEHLNTEYERLSSLAMNSAQADPRYRAARQPWVECLNGRGITFSGDRLGVFPAVPSSPAAMKRQAVIDVQCKLEVDMVPRLAGLVAEYENDIIQRESNLFLQLQEKKNVVMAEVERTLAGG